MEAEPGEFLIGRRSEQVQVSSRGRGRDQVVGSSPHQHASGNKSIESIFTLWNNQFVLINTSTDQKSNLGSNVFLADVSGSFLTTTQDFQLGWSDFVRENNEFLSQQQEAV